MTCRTTKLALSHFDDVEYGKALQFLEETIALFEKICIGDEKKATWKPVQTGVILATSVLLLQALFLEKYNFKFLLLSRFGQYVLENLFSTLRCKNPVPRVLGIQVFASSCYDGPVSETKTRSSFFGGQASPSGCRIASNEENNQGDSSTAASGLRSDCARRGQRIARPPYHLRARKQPTAPQNGQQDSQAHSSTGMAMHIDSIGQSSKPVHGTEVYTAVRKKMPRLWKQWKPLRLRRMSGIQQRPSWFYTPVSATSKTTHLHMIQLRRSSQITSWKARAKGHFFVVYGVPEVGPKDDTMRIKCELWNQNLRQICSDIGTRVEFVSVTKALQDKMNGISYSEYIAEQLGQRLERRLCAFLGLRPSGNYKHRAWRVKPTIFMMTALGQAILQMANPQRRQKRSWHRT
ncbi:hypothetical protein HPB51_025373 [Rhipicephalus microplus]|uniref:Uncharacterized protein n=1 Tax=Rhipicephalus microplus TaxID=6941 RepID=A0A9J6DDI8_RHIMP|nr:hypothetical protein HPB51_025373 [Rhipicephalus microplus]